MSSGQVEFIQKGRDDQAEPGDLNYPSKVAACFGIDANQFLKAFCKPKIKVGAEWVTKGQTCDQATSGCGGIARAVYDRVFKWLIEKCNDTLIDPTMKKNNFCAVLDIAGFEIFEYNGFEQISINFVNEKLQQFFNHTMFVVEQEEYVAEGVELAPVDFGMDAAACITMFEKPMGIWAILQEETLFPKATDKSFADKLQAGLGKLPNFVKPQSKTDPNAHFACVHYAGTVSYNVTAWLEKNKDPVNDTVVDVLKQGSNALMVYLWRDNPGQSNPPEEDKNKKKKKGGGAKTVSSVYLFQLNALMTTLHATEPHFIRCIVPNTHKQPLVVETELIMHQLTCNGVLEGIRVCMLGFPNRMLYPDFKGRYVILGAAEIASSSDNKLSVRALMEKIAFPVEKYQLGHTKVFFRAGALAGLEEVRDAIVLKLVRFMQGQCFGHIKRKVYSVKNDQRELMKVIQRNFRKFQTLRSWGWFIIIQKTRPLIGQINLEDELRILEEQANTAYGVYEEALTVTKTLEGVNKETEAELKALTSQLESEQGNLSMYHERQAKASALKADNEAQLETAQKNLAIAEGEKQDLTADRKTMEADINNVKKDIEDLDLAFNKLEQEKTNRDHTIRSLSDEVAQQDEVINKLNKEKKMIADNQGKAYEDLTVAQEKVDHLNSIKSKLEATFDELEDGVSREKRARGEIGKAHRNTEGQLKLAQETVNELESAKRDLENIMGRKEKDIGQLSSKLDDEQSLVAKVQKSIKEHQGRVEELEEELDAERQARAKAERQRSDLAKEMERIGDRLADAGGATAAQAELNKKREYEVGKLRKDLEEANIANESVLMSLKKKHQDAIQEMTEQVDRLSKAKSKIDKDKVKVSAEAADARAATDEVARGKASSEKSNKALVGALNDLGKKIEEANMTLGDFESQKKRLAAENADLLGAVGGINNNVNMVLKMKSSLVSALDDAKHLADTEAQERHLLLGKFKNLEAELDALKGHLDEEVGGRDEIIRQTTKAEGEAGAWRSKYESDAVGKAEELEMVKMKLTARLTEAETAADNLNAKLASIEKAKGKLHGEINEASVNLDQATILNNLMEKKAKQFDKLVGEWKAKAAGLGMDLDVAQMECRNASSEVFKIKNAYEESGAQLDAVRQENKMLSNEIKDIMDQISEGGRSIHEIDKIRKRLAAEKSELQGALEEAEGALEQEENKVLRAQIELAQIRKEVDHRIAEKEEQFLGIKNNMTKGTEGMQAALETEAKGKAEALRMKKKLESDVGELEIALEHSNANNVETQKAIKKYQVQIRDCATKLADEQRSKEIARDTLVASEKKAHGMQNALEETKTLLEQADRNRRTVEHELADVNESLSDTTVQNQAIAAAKRKLESEMATLHADLDVMTNEAAICDDKAGKAMVDAAKLAAELGAEQEASMALSKNHKLADIQVEDMQTKLDEADMNALKGGKKAMNKLESRIRELQSELEAESRRHAEGQRNLNKSERSIKELSFASDEDRKNHERMQALIDQLQSKIKCYKKQIEEAEEIAALNLAKFRKVQGNLSDAEAHADLNEQALGKAKRGASMGPT